MWDSSSRAIKLLLALVALFAASSSTPAVDDVVVVVVDVVIGARAGECVDVGVAFCGVFLVVFLCRVLVY